MTDVQRGTEQASWRTLPGFTTVRTYQPRWLSRDLVAGLVLTTLLVPQGMAYAELAGLPPITGLYTTVLALLGYAVFGPSRVLVLGPDSSLGPMIAATVIPLVTANGDPGRAVAYASMLALMVGAITVLAGIFRLGFVADLLSKPTQLGYMNGLALTILVGQLPKLFGFSVDADNFLDEAAGFFRGLVDGDTVGPALAVGVGSLILILLFQRILPRVPGVLVAVVLAIGCVTLFDLPERGVDVVGPMPEGLPPFVIPSVPLEDFGLLLAGALGIALVSLTDTISTASVFAARRGEEVSADREMVAVGAASIAAGLFQGFPVSTSGSRTAVAAQNGAKTQVTGLVGALAIAALLVFAPGLLRNLPQPTLAAVVIAASLSLADLPGLRRLGRQRRSDFVLALAAFLGVALLGVLPGIGIAVGLSILVVFNRAWRPHQAVLGRSEDLAGYHDLTFHPATTHLPGLVIYRFDAPLFFANARSFRDQVRALAAAEPRPAWILVAAEPITDIDTTAADMLGDLVRGLHEQGIRLVFAELKDPVRRRLDHYELTDTIKPGDFFETIRMAVEAYQASTGRTWERGPGSYEIPD
ncbi:high affinity sulfate transporter 1 [Kribbella amoyensis]|uniref:High affinity sulfate transporter 1 n=1 Tax=Kribbella amoyensis TaxID=996641 RepID=A0A561B7R3_9ACTN|nr:SulP family inorganic anion transporter [Kribbella amoyensis]TWD74798.1 high affinity sulfate transporter 1 [Kribbella amoyensis]